MWDVKSILAGIIMRNDHIIDGFTFGTITVSEDDATNIILNMCQSRSDTSYCIIWGSIMAHYNIVDIRYISKSLRIPVLAASCTHHKDISHRLPPEKLHTYNRLPNKNTIRLNTGHTLDTHLSGCTIHEARQLLNHITIQGGMPEPIRLARTLASSVRQYRQADP